MLLHSVSQLLTLAGGSQRGDQLGQLGIINNGAVLFNEEGVLEVGTTDDLLKKYTDEERISARNRAVLPGFIDAHTHLVWAGNRAAEFAMRLEGKSYLAIMEAGGGIQSTVNATREADHSNIKAQTAERARIVFQHGTTTAEAKSGYGLDIETEFKQLDVLMDIDKEEPLEIVPTFLGAHAIPQEYKNHPQEYVDFVCSKALPRLMDWWKKKYAETELPFVDVFCEKGAFDLRQSRQILETAKSLGFPLKIHADEFENLGGTSLAVELGATSADHLVKTSMAEIDMLANSSTVAVSLPCTPFGLAEEEYTPAKEMIKAGCILAIATDLNPGTAWSGNMQFAMALACRYMGMTPAQVIAASTINAAAAIGKQNIIGSIEKGKQADMVILSTPDYRQLPYRFGTNLIETVIKKGIVYDKNSLC